MMTRKKSANVQYSYGSFFWIFSIQIESKGCGRLTVKWQVVCV
jgi:hypothetical protein